MKKLLLILILVLICCSFYLISYNESNLPKANIKIDNSIQKKLISRVKEVQIFTSKHPKFNDSIGFFVDLKIPSGKNRFFIYNLKKNKLIDQGLVAHGSGCETRIDGKLQFSNVENSNCSSLGKYYVDNSYYGQFGKAYKLHGLDKTNSNAYTRNIVLHKYSCVPLDVQEEPICNSLGCPMVNEKYFKRIENILDNSEKNIILYIYY